LKQSLIIRKSFRKQRNLSLVLNGNLRSQKQMHFTGKLNPRLKGMSVTTLKCSLMLSKNCVCLKMMVLIINTIRFMLVNGTYYIAAPAFNNQFPYVKLITNNYCMYIIAELL
jgi:hypothetical protein